MSIIIKNVSDKIIDLFLKSALTKLKSFVQENLDKVEINQKFIEESLCIHLAWVDNWSSIIKIKESKAKLIESVFIPLDFYSGPSRLKYESAKSTISLDDIIKTNNHSVILGQPGAGKTTSMQFISQKVLLDEFSTFEKYPFPLVLRFRDLPYKKKSEESLSLMECLLNILGISIKYYRLDDLTEEERKIIIPRGNLIEKSVIAFLDALHPIVILDGFDEIPEYSLRNSIIKEIEKLTLSLKNAKVFLTSRTGEFPFSVANTNEFEIAYFTEKKIKIFINKWLNDKKRASELFNQISKSPYYDTTLRPLTLSQLCAIYEREGKIPPKPKSIYDKVVKSLLEEWNMQSTVIRESKFIDFAPDRKCDFLSHLAYYLTVECTGTVFSREDLKEAYIEIYDNFSLGQDEMNKVVDELESHTGLFIQSGYNKFQFPHKSIQEYLTANFLVKSWTLPERTVLLKIPNELAIAVSLASIPSDYFSSLMLNLKSYNLNRAEFIEPFLNRIIIEKTDFKVRIDLGLSFLFIYNCCMHDNLNESGNNEYRYPHLNKFLDTLYQTFSSIRESVSIVISYYDVKETDYLFKDECLIVKNNSPFIDQIYTKGYHQISTINYPSRLIIKRKYYK